MSSPQAVRVRGAAVVRSLADLLAKVPQVERSLRSFAEVLATDDEAPAPSKAHRRRATPRQASVVPSDLDQARAKHALRNHGVFPK